MIPFSLFVVVLLAMVLAGAARAQGGPLLDRTGNLRQLFVAVRPLWTVEEQALYATRTETDIYGKTERYEWHMHQGAWIWRAESGIEVTAFRTYYATPSLQDAVAIRELAVALTYSSTIAWNPAEGFATPVGSLGLRVPRLELVLWYEDGTIRHLMISQVSTVQGGMYALMFDHVASSTEPHPLGLYVLDAAPAAELVRFATMFVE